MREKHRRYEHWLYQTGKGSWPPCVLCVDVTVAWDRMPGDGDKERARLISWRCVRLIRSGDSYYVADSRCGTSADGWWVAVAEALDGVSSVWVLSADTRVALSTLGVWHGIETRRLAPAGQPVSPDPPAAGPVRPVSERVLGGALGRVESVGAHPVRRVRRDVGVPGRRKHAAAGGAKSPRDGIILLNDPPLVLQLQVVGQKGVITWVDAANYGLDTHGGGGEGRTDAATLSDWFVRAASTLHSLGPVGWRVTAGSQAMHLFRSIYLATPILSHTHRGATTLETAGLFGGRNECYRVGRINERVWVYDIRSMYPYVCTQELLPVSLVAAWQVRPVADLVAAQDDYYCIAHVDLDTPHNWYPYRRQTDVIYPVGRFTTALGGPELSRALRAGHVCRVRRAALYRRNACLASYATALYGVRKDAIERGEPDIAAWIKRLLVCLPGKFAQRDRFWTTRHGAEPLYEWGEWYRELPGLGICRWRSIGGIVQVERELEYVSGAVPAITAAVCAAGRERLLRIILCAGGRNVYYTDTDSVVVNESGRESLIQHGWVRPDELGYLREEVSAEGCDIIGLKHYRIGKKVRFAGQPGGGPAYYSAAGPPPIVPWIGQSMASHEKPAEYRAPHPIARGAGRYDGPRDPDGWVRPVTVDEWED